MKKLFLLSALLAIPALAGTITQSCGNDTSKIEPRMFSFALPDGDTESDIRQPFHLDRLECAFLSAGSFKLERIRGLENIPYIDHRTNDGSVVDWKITSGTTFDDRVESFTGLIQLEGGGYSDDTAVSPYYMVRGVEDGDPRLQYYGGSVQDSQGRYGYAPCVYYSFASNALYLAEVIDSPELWTPLGTPGRFRYDTSVYRPMQGFFTAIIDTVNGVTNFLADAKDPKNLYSDILFAGVDMPTELAVSESATTPVGFRRGYTVTNYAVWATCSMTVTNVFVDSSVGTEFATNLTDAVVLPKDVLRISGSAMPTGHVIGIGRK